MYKQYIYILFSFLSLTFLNSKNQFHLDEEHLGSQIPVENKTLQATFPLCETCNMRFFLFRFAQANELGIFPYAINLDLACKYYFRSVLQKDCPLKYKLLIYNKIKNLYEIKKNKYAATVLMFIARHLGPNLINMEVDEFQKFLANLRDFIVPSLKIKTPSNFSNVFDYNFFVFFELDTVLGVVFDFHIRDQVCQYFF